MRQGATGPQAEEVDVMRWNPNSLADDAIDTSDASSELSTALTDTVGWRMSIRTAGRLGFGRCKWRRSEPSGLSLADPDPSGIGREVPIRPTILGPGMFP